MQLLLFRPKPLPGELLSQWIVRLAWANSQKVNSFSWKRLRLPPRIWDTDIDRSLSDRFIDQIAAVTGTDAARARATSLRHFDGRVWEQLHVSGSMQWLMPVGIKARHRRSPGQQYCPLCLAEGDVPYFRQVWRLSFPVCLVHKTWLADRCHRCYSAVNLHNGDYGRWALHQFSPWTFCRTCGADWRSAEAERLDQKNPVEGFLAKFEAAIAGHWVLIGSEALHPLSFMYGVRKLLAVLASNASASRLRISVAHCMGVPPFRTAHQNRHLLIEELESDERRRLFEMLCWLLGDWPGRFLRTAKQSQASSDWFRPPQLAPWWLDKHLTTSLNRGRYRPTLREKQELVLFLRSRDLSVSDNNIRRWLGQSCKLGLTPAAYAKQRAFISASRG